MPERAGDEHYVFRLTDSAGPGASKALGLGVRGDHVGRQGGAFLTGSFGSGKSRSMAVLHALLRQDPSARSKTELQPLIAQQDPALRARNVLPLAFHLLSAEALQQAIFSGYIWQVRDLTPTPRCDREGRGTDGDEPCTSRTGCSPTRRGCVPRSGMTPS